MVVGTGASITRSGTGTISASTAVTATTATSATTATTASALAANGTNCPTRQSPLGVDAAGNAEGCFDAGHVVEDEGMRLLNSQ